MKRSENHRVTHRDTASLRRLILVRHAQASIESDHYDQLSPLGERQARILGEHWVRSGFVPDVVYLGPLVRHRQTAEQVAEVFRHHGFSWPEAQVLPEFDEHAGMEVVKEALPMVVAQDRQVAAWARAMEENPGQRVHYYFKIFRRLTSLWSRGELGGNSSLESWPAFRQRVGQGMERMVAGEGRVSVAFTSAGSMAAAVARGLELGDEKTLELSWAVHNTGLSEFIERRGGLVLRTFNALPHLTEDDLVTWV